MHGDVTHFGSDVYASFYMSFVALMLDLAARTLGETLAEKTWANHVRGEANFFYASNEQNPQHQ